eukprot:268859_1
MNAMICIIILLSMVGIKGNHSETKETLIIYGNQTLKAQTLTHKQTTQPNISTQIQSNEKRNNYGGFIRRLAETNDWINAGTVLPRAAKSMAVAYWNDMFYLFGGYCNYWNPGQKQLVTLDNSYHFTDHGTNALTSALKANSHVYTQIYNTKIVYYHEYSGLYSPSTNRIVIYDLEQKNEIGAIFAPQNIDYGICVTSGNDILYTFGGGAIGHSSTVQGYNISAETWLTNISNMQTERVHHTCIFDELQGQLWVIGGYNGFSHLKSVEIISTNQINTEYWHYSEDLVYETRSHSSIYYNGHIITMGGFNSNQRWLNKVQIINCTTGYVFMSGLLNYKIRNAAGILIADRVYLFGGSDEGNNNVDTAQYWDINLTLRQNPTRNPTQNPTILTLNPTILTLNPTKNPTKNPTRNPAKIATQKTEDPTQNISQFPWWIFIIIVPVIITVLVCALAIGCVYKKRKSNQNMRNDILEEGQEGINLINLKQKTERNDDEIVSKVTNTMFDMNKETIDRDIMSENKEYQTWTFAETYEWIMSLENGIFQIYSSELLHNLRNENVSGDCIGLMNENDLHRLGIIQFKHKKILLKQIEELVSNVTEEGEEI